MKNDRNNGWPWVYRLKKAPCVGIFSLFKSGKTKSDTYQKRKAIFGAKTKSDENNKGDTRNSIAFIITLMMGYTFKSNFTFSSPANNCCVFPILFS